MNIPTSKLRSQVGFLFTAIAAMTAICSEAAEPAASAIEPVFVLIEKQRIPVYPATLPTALRLDSPGITEEGHEYLVVRTAAGANAVVLVTVENGGVTLTYGTEKIGKGQQLLVDGNDFPTLAASGLHAPAELEKTTSITGRPVAEITRLGRPGTSSGIGFMAEDETILSVLQGDNNLVRQLNLKHPDLARPLFHVWNLLLVEYELGKLGRFKDDVVSFRYRGHEIHIRTQKTKGFQDSIFNDEIKGAFDIELWRELDENERNFLTNTYAHVSEAERKATIERLTRIRTGEMEPYYIMRYGFYEGHTAYRVDPVALAVLFGLKPLTEVEKAFPAKLDRILTTHFTDKNTAGEIGEVETKN